MNDSEKENIDAGDKFHLPDGFLEDPKKWWRGRQKSLLTVQQKTIHALQDFERRQTPKHQPPEK
ncbi:MAG TPA: hypothetical protein VMY37_10005 [Thermoguttaceae bacterium]|nr:hypothetical protein [Thermoguttaceae bacterium]